MRKYMLGQPLTAPAAERNKEPILGVLRQVLPESGLVVTCGSKWRTSNSPTARKNRSAFSGEVLLRCIFSRE